MRHLLVTNDFPPKIGGIQSLLWELWRRLPADSFTVMTTPYEGAAEWDATQPFDVVRTRQKWLLPTPALVRQINRLADETDADLIVLDPAFPLGLCGPRLNRPYVLVVHGAELVIPGHMPVIRQRLRRLFAGSLGVVASGEYVRQAVLNIAGAAAPKVISIPPGVDVDRFVPLDEGERLDARSSFGLPAEARLVVGVSRLVPRKGFDRLIKAAATLKNDFPDLHVAIGGKGREGDRLRRLAERLDAPVTFLGRVDDERLPALYGCADAFAMPCHDRWFGLEREGFGIVFMEAAAVGIPTVVGHSGGSDEAVDDGITGYLVGGGVSATAVAVALRKLLADGDGRRAMGRAGRQMAVDRFAYEGLSGALQAFLGSRGKPS